MVSATMVRLTCRRFSLLSRRLFTSTTSRATTRVAASRATTRVAPTFLSEDEAVRQGGWQCDCVKTRQKAKEIGIMAVSTRSDEEIQRDILEELKWDSRVRPNEIGVAVKDGVVTLTGWGDSYWKKKAAEEAAHR